ncbi:LOW QUALITY PROTEIN: uncharacterized protein [Primulina eburnea]|uniref:LOW QUALITY PROTEIN: uncharacterized protein n=1 Tax=Primulina eburnea TaxID=1245227 RepID=UPI003C6BF908
MPAKLMRMQRKVAIEHATDALHLGEAKLDAEESNGLEKGLVSALEVPASSEIGHDESIPVYEAGLSENKEDSENTIPEKEAAHKKSLKVNPEDTKTCVAVNDTEARSSVEEKIMTSSTSQDIPGERNEQTTFDTNKETPENVSTIVPKAENKLNLSIELVGSQMKTDENLEKEDEKPESTLIPEGKIENEELTQNELFETKNETEKVIQNSEEVDKNGVESSPVAAPEDEDMEASTSDHNTKASALENKIPTENPQEILVDKYGCKPEKETLEEQVITETTTDASHNETTPVDKAKTEDEEPNKSDFIETKEDRERTILVEEPISEKHLESFNAIHDDIKACDLVQDTEAKSSIKDKLPTKTPQEIWGDKIEQTSLDTKEETLEDISTNVSNERIEQNSIVEVPFVTEALTTDNETEGKIKDEDQREKDSIENNNDTESELPKQKATEKPVESLQLANMAEATQASTLDHDTKISALENQIPTENSQEIVADETKSKPCDVVDSKKETLDVQTLQDVSTIESNDDSEENLVIEEDEREKPLSREESTRDAAGDESTYTYEDKNEGDDQRRAELFENPNFAESLSLIEDNTRPKLVESPQAEVIKTYVLDQETETTGQISASEGNSNDGESAVKYEVKTEDDDQKEDQLCDSEKNPESNVLLEAAQIETPIESLQETLPSTVPQGFLDDKTEEKRVDAIQKDKEILDNISTIVPNEEIEQNLSVELDSDMKTDENLEKEDEKPESTLIPEGKIKNEESTQNELFETENETETETETVIQRSKEVIEKVVESSPVAASEAGDIETSTSDHGTETSSIGNKIATENLQEIEVDKSVCKPEKETPNQQVSKSASMTSEDALLTKHEPHLEKESEKPCFKDASMGDASHDETTPIHKAMKEDDEPSKSELLENKEDTESTILVEEPILGKHLESLNAIHDDIKACDLVQDTETKSSIKEKLQTATPQEIWGDKIDQTSFDTKEETPEDISTNVSNEETEQNSIVEVPFVTEALTTDNELAITGGKIEDEDQRGKDLLENNYDTESELLKQEVTEKPVESLQLANEADDTKVSTSDHDTTLSVLENQILTENPREIVAGETESKPCDVVDTKKETLDGQDVSTIESNDDNEENLVIEEDESEKPLLREESIRDAVGDESIYTNEDKKEVEDQRRAELFENENSAESLSLIEDDTIPKLVKSSQVDAEDIKTHVLDQDAETTSLISASEGKSNDGESAVKYVVKTEDDDQKEDQLCDSEKNPESKVLLEAAQLETPIASLQETLPSTVPQGFLDDETEEKTVDAIHTNKEILDVQNVTKTVSNEKIEEHSLIQMDGSPIQHEESLEKEHERPSLIESIDHDSLFQVDGSRIQCKEYSEEKSEITSIIEASTKNINDDNPVNVHEGSSEHEDLRKDEFGDTEVTSQEEEAQVETAANSTNIAAEDIIASDLCQETETTSSQEERTLNEEETVCEQIEVETLDASDTKRQTSETQDVSTIVPNDDSGENSATEENDLQMKNKETFGKETEKPYVNETSKTDASDDDSANKCEDKVEGDEQTGAELFEEKKDMESKLLKEEEIMVRLVESPQVDNEAIKTYVSDGVETTGMVEESEGDADNHESAVKNEVKTEDNDKKEDELSENEKKTESGELLEAAQTEKSIESLQETLPSTVPRGFLDDNTEEKLVDALQKDEGVQNVTTTVPNEKIEENSLIQMDGSQIQHEEYLEKEHEMPSVIEASTKLANYDELIAREDNIEHEDPRKVEPEIEKYTEINLKEDDTQIETHIAEDIIASDSYQATETTDSQKEQILNENEIVHEETQVERLDAADTKQETPESPDVSTFVLNDDNEENLVIEEDDSEMKNEDNLGKESENLPSIEASLMDTSSDESTKKFEDKGREQTRVEETERTLLKEAETPAQPLESPQVDAEDIKTYVSDQGEETTGLVEVFEEVAIESRPEVKCMIKTKDNDQKEDELCDDEKIPDGTSHLEVAKMEKPFESLKEALPTSIPRGFLEEKTEEKIIDATEKDEETLEIQNQDLSNVFLQQNVTTIVSNENIEHDSLLQVDSSQMQCKECPEGESERTPVTEASTKNMNDDDSITVHEDTTEHEDQRKDELVETKEDTKITSQKEEAQVETAVKSLKIAAEDIIESDSHQETETMSSQEEKILNDGEIVCEQIEVITLDTADKKTETPEAQDVSRIVPNDDIEASSATGDNDSQMKNKENLGKESRKPSVIEAWTMDASGDESTNKREDKVHGEEQTGAEMFVDKKDTESTLLKEEEIMVKLVESPHVDTVNIKTYVSDEGAETTGVVKAFEGNANVDKSAIKYEVKTEDTDQKDNEKNPESGALLEEAQIEQPIESLKETLTSTVPRESLDDKTEEKTMDAIEKDKEILDLQSVAKTVSIEKIEDNSLIQAESSRIQHEEYLEKEIEIPSGIEASTKHADDDELISIHEDNIEHKDLRKKELLESNRDTEINLQKEEAQMETSVKPLQVAVASDSYPGTETTSKEEQFLNENEIIHETEVERLDTADSEKEIPESQNFATILSSENIKENSRILEDGSEQKHEELLEKESKELPFSETSTMEVNDEVPEVIHQDKIEDEKLEKFDKFECDKHEEITLSNEAPAEKLQESSKEDLEDIKDIVSGANTIERSLIEVQSPNENRREIVSDHMDENIVDKDPEVREIEDEHMDKDVMFKNEKHTEIGFIKEEESVKKLQEPEKKDLEEIKAFVSHEGTETTSSIEERDLTAISQESVGDLSEDKILDKAQERQDFTIVSGERAEKYSSIQPDGSQIKQGELSEKKCEMLSTPETSFPYSSNDEPINVDVENIENEHLNKVDKFEDEKHTKIAIINDQAPVEGPQESSRRDIEEVKAFVSWEGAETSSSEEQGLTEISPEITGDKSEKKILDKVGTTQEFTKFVSYENGGEISLMLVDDSQIKHEELLEKESEASPLSETSLRNSNFNEPSILHQDKIEDELLNRVDKFESEKHAEISMIKEEAPVEKLNESSLRKDLEEIKAFDLFEDMETSSTGERNLTAIPQENDFSTVDASQIKHEKLLERESETPPLPLLHSSDRKSAIVHTGKIEDEVLEKADKFEGIESGEAAMLKEEAQAEKLSESSKDLEGIKESITCDGTEITHSTEEQNLTTISQEIIDHQEDEKVLNVAGEASDFTTIIPDNNNTERNLLVEVHASQMKHEEHLEEEREMPSLFMLNTSTEETTIVRENKVMEHVEIILSHEEALENSSKEENENIKASVFCEDTETSSIEQESLTANSHEIVGGQVKEKIIDMAQNAPDLTTITSDENSEENSLIQLDRSQIKHEEPLERESKTPSMSMLDTTIEESTILQGHITDDQDPRKVDEFEYEKDTEATILKELTPAEKVTDSTKDDLEDTKVIFSCEDKEITSSIEEQSQKDNQQEIVVDQTQKNILDSATEAQDFKQTVSHENAGENLLIQVDESEGKHEIVSDQTQENVLDTAPKDQDLKPAISHENAEENSLLQVDKIQMKHDELEKESETPSLLIVGTSNKESKTIYEDITEDENRKKIHDFECEKHEVITSTEEETQVTKVDESSKENLEDVKALVSGEDSETTSFEEKQSLKENPRQILSDQQEDKIQDIAHEPQNFIKVVSNENVEKDSLNQEDGSPMVHEEISEKEGETPSLSADFILNTTSEDSTVIHENKIEDEDIREVDIFECEKHVDGKIPDTTHEAPESKIIVLDEKTEEKSSNQVDKSQTKHEELLEKESKTLSLSKTSLLNTSSEDSTTINDDKIEDEDPEKVELECEKHTEFPLTKEEPGQILNNTSKEDIEEIKEFVSLDTETTSSTEDRSLQINSQEVMGDQMEENIIDTTPEPQTFTTLVSDENIKKNLSLEDDESQIKHEELLENESEKPSLWILKTSNEESSFICHRKTENEGVKRHEKVEQLTHFPEEGPEIIEVPVPSENLETPSPVEERSPTENPQENLTKDEILDVVPKALQESKTIVSDKNIEENSFILEDGSQMKHEEHSVKESEKPSVSENSILNTRNEEPTLFLNDKIEEEDQAKCNKSECEKHAEITEVSAENPNSSNLENIEDIEPTNSTEEQSLIVNPIENLDGQEVEKVLDKALEAPDITPVVPDDNNGDNPSIKVDGSQMKLEELLEKESEMASSLGTSLLNTNNEETENIHRDLIEDEALENVDEFESKKCSEINKLKEAQVEESTVYKDIKAYVLYQDTEASALEEQILAANPQDILGNESEDNVIDTADSKDKITEQNLPSNESVVKDSLIQIDESKTKHEEISEKEPYLEKTSMVEANNESTTSHEDMIEEEIGKIMESALLNEGSPAYASVESSQVVSEDIKASVSSQKTDTKTSNLNSDPQEIVGDQTDDKINTAGTREITLEALNLTTPDSNENKVLDSMTPHDGLEIEDEKVSMLADNEESIIDESMDSLHVASEPIKASVSCQDGDPTSSLEEQILTTTPKIVVDQVEEKLTDTAKTWEETLEVSSSVLAFQEDESNRIGVDDINSVMIKDEETVKISNSDENDGICSSDKVQAKEEEMEILPKPKLMRKQTKMISGSLIDDETNKTSIEEKEIDFSSHDKDTSEISRHDGAKEIPKGNENSTAKNEFLEDGNSNGSIESTTPIGNEDAEKIDKDIKAETVVTETGAASSALSITGVQRGPEETESEDSTEKETETSLAPEGREYQGQHTKIHGSPSPLLSHVKDSEWERAQERGIDNLQNGDDTNDDTKELDEGSVAISNEGNFLDGNLNENIETEVTAGEKEASAIQQDPVSEFVVQEIQEQPGKTVEAVPEEKGIKSEQVEDDSDNLKINSSTTVTDKVAPSDILCSFTSDAGQKAVGQETQIVVQEKQKPGKGKAVEAVPEEKGINTEENEIKEHDFNVLKENSRTVALDKVTPVNILQGSTTDAALRATDEETPEQYGLDEASLKEIERGPASTTDKLIVLRADQIDNANFDSSLGSNKIPVLQHGDSSESSQTEGEKQKTSEPEKGQKHGNEETSKLMEMSESTEMDKLSLSGLLQEPMKDVLKVVDHSIDKKEPTTKEEELLAEKSAEVEQVEVKTDKEKDSKEEPGENQISELSSDAPAMVGAADKDVEVTHKKSHNILSGIGSKVKHSISKVKKAITHKSSHPKSASPKYSDRI